MFQHLFIDLLIHGEGGDGGAGAAPGGEAGPGPEAAGVTAPDAGVQNRRLTKEERRARFEERLRAEQQAQQPQVQQPQAQQQQKTPWEEIKKQYKDEYGKDVQTAIQGRFKNQADSESALNAAKAELSEQNELMILLGAKYGLKPGEDGKIDIKALRSAAEDDDELYERRADELGVSSDTAKYITGLERKADKQTRELEELRRAEALRKQDQEKYARFQQHRQQAEAFRQKMPGFDLVKEMESNPTFTKLLASGFPVETSYYATHHDELMSVGQQAAAIQAQRALASQIQAGQSMPTEGGLGRSPAASPQRAAGPKTWTKAQRAEVRRRAMKENVYL